MRSIAGQEDVALAVARRLLAPISKCGGQMERFDLEFGIGHAVQDPLKVLQSNLLCAIEGATAEVQDAEADVTYTDNHAVLGEVEFPLTFSRVHVSMSRIGCALRLRTNEIDTHEPTSHAARKSSSPASIVTPSVSCDMLIASFPRRFVTPKCSARSSRVSVMRCNSMILGLETAPGCSVLNGSSLYLIDVNSDAGYMTAELKTRNFLEGSLFLAEAGDFV